MKKIAMMLTSIALVAAVAVGGTLAWLTSTPGAVTNTFTVGNVAITLDEAKVNLDGTPVQGADRVTTNAYKLQPGHTYTKDPTIHVDTNSESCWVFVKIENGISNFEAATESNGYTNIASQVTANGWTALDNVAGVYFQKYTASETAVKDLKVFDTIKISDTANTVEGWANIAQSNITITGYAIQADGFDTAAAAWAAGAFN